MAGMLVALDEAVINEPAKTAIAPGNRTEEPERYDLITGHYAVKEQIRDKLAITFLNDARGCFRFS
jgi:hypothetical protein